MKALVVFLLVALALQAFNCPAKGFHTPTSEVFSPSRSLGVGLALSVWTVDVQSIKYNWFVGRRRRRRRRRWLGR